jgi:hypothetical protein
VRPLAAREGSEMRRVPGFTPMRLALVLTVGFFVVVLVVASIATLSGGNDAQTVSNTTSSGGERVKVIIAGTNDALEEQTDGGIAGEGTFRAAGAITDKGPVTAYRAVSTLNEGLILLRFVTKGRKGAITYLVRIDTTRRPVISRWTIESGTKAYKGLRGKGIESENATYTVSTLRGKMWR